MRTRSFFGAIGLLVLAPIVLNAQITTTTLFGTVTDKSGAVVADADVTATNTGTNLVRSSKANAQGEYRIEFLPIGNYSVAINVTGFKKFIQNGIALEVGQAVRLDASLDVGSTGEVVEVTSTTPIVNTSSPELGR